MSRFNTPNKRNLSSTSSTSSSPKAGDKKSKIFVSTNKYAALADDFGSTTEVFSPPPVPTSPSIQDAVTVDSNSPVIQPLDVEHLKSPPIFVKNIANINALKSDLISITGPDGFTLSAFNDVLKIKTPNCKYHLLIIKYLMDENKEYFSHTFRPRHLRPIKAVIRNIHHSTALEEIETALSDLGFSVVSSNEVPEDHARQLPRKSYAAATKTVTSPMDSISNVLSEFISNFNSLITPLINLLTTIVNKRFCP
ncbi:hypothetical protein ACI65C_009858 [Semiaphis heraclei]